MRQNNAKADGRRFPKWRRLRKRREFLRVYRKGGRAYGRNVYIVVAKNGLSHSRLGVTVSKKVGKAVVRNRIKRLIREYYRLNKDKFPPGYDYVVTARPGAEIRNLSDLEVEFGALLAKVGGGE